MSGFGRGRRRCKKGGELGMDLDRDGREPLAHALLLLLHPAECSAEGPLRDLKGYTLVGAKWWLGCGVLHS